jgi:hypothetical protein
MKSILTQEQSNDYNRAKKQMVYCGLPLNAPKVLSYKPFSDEVVLLGETLALIEGTESDKAVSSKDVTTGKVGLKHDFAEFLGGICLEALAYSIKYDGGIDSVVKIRADEIFKLKDSDIVGFANLISDTVGPKIADMNLKFYTTSALDLANGIVMGEDYAATIGQGGVIRGGGTVAAGVIEGYFETIGEIQKQFFLLKNHWKISDHSFYEGIIVSSVVVDSGHVFNGIKGVVTGGATNVLLGDAIITNNRTGKSVGCNVLAQYIWQGLQCKLDNYTVSCPGFISLVEAIKIDFRETKVVNFHLEPVA